MIPNGSKKIPTDPGKEHTPRKPQDTTIEGFPNHKQVVEGLVCDLPFLFLVVCSQAPEAPPMVSVEPPDEMPLVTLEVEIGGI